MKVLLIIYSSEAVNTLSFTLKIRWPDATLIHVANGSAGVEMVETESPDIVIVDIEMPDIDGFEVLKQIRLFSDVPAILLSSKAVEVDRVRGLEMGADDFIMKPINPLEFLARIQAVLRRTGVVHLEELPPFNATNLAVDFATREVLFNGKQVHLTPTEYKLLSHLIRNEGKVVMQESLKRLVWDDPESLDSSTIKKYVYHLRTKLGDSSKHPRMIVNERGVGYKFVRPR